MTITEKFIQLKKEKKKAFIVYVPFGFPTQEASYDIILTLQDAGVDIIELGIPFSDPLADGPIIQKATTRALEEGADQKKLFSLLEDLKKKIKIPLVIMTYYNPLYAFGMRKFFKKMRDAKVTGIMVVDLPVEESRNYIKMAEEHKLETIFFITPTTTFQRAKAIVQYSQGFIYYISVTGITGPHAFTLSSIAAHIKKLRTITSLPICVGFGIHTKTQVAEIMHYSDGVIVGSSIIKCIDKHYPEKDFLKKLKNYALSLRA